MRNVLLIDDAPEMPLIVRSALEHEFGVICCGSVADARAYLAQSTPDLILLDIGLPDGDGFGLCAKLKEDARTAAIPVIFLTGKSEIEAKIMGFSLGAEDFIVKPFHPAELRIRVESRIRKIGELNEKGSQLLKGDLKVDLAKQEVYYLHAGGEERLELTQIDFKLLLYMLRHEGHVLSRDQLLSSVWGTNVNLIDRTVDAHVSHLRKKLGNSRCVLKSIHGVGYRLQFETKSSSNNEQDHRRRAS